MSLAAITAHSPSAPLEARRSTSCASRTACVRAVEERSVDDEPAAEQRRAWTQIVHLQAFSVMPPTRIELVHAV
jgi:hypothetical protein